MTVRKIIEIDEEKCTGCGDCIISCAEGALQIVDGKAKLVGDVYCDGLGACLGECPEGALKIVERDAPEFDEAAVEELLKKQSEPAAAEPTMACGCPSSQSMTLEREPVAAKPSGAQESQLGHWPVKLQLLGPDAPYLKGSDMVLLADCVATAYPNLHQDLIAGRTVAMGCPKLDDLEAHINRLAEILAGAGPRSLTVAHMEVPCCKGFVYAAEKAIEISGVRLPLNRIKISRTGQVLEQEQMICEHAGCNCAEAAGSK